MKQAIIALTGVAFILSGCASTGTDANRAGLGALGGAIGGAVISKATGGNTARDAAIGALVGGVAGSYMERQAKELESQMQGTGVSVSQNTVTGAIDLVMPGNITFAYDDARLAPGFKPTLDKLAATMRTYQDTAILIEGHTDSNGSDSYNMDLSRDRANAVAQYLINRGVAYDRIEVRARGERSPIATNATEHGRAQNRRVEIAITQR